MLSLIESTLPNGLHRAMDARSLSAIQEKTASAIFSPWMTRNGRLQNFPTRSDCPSSIPAALWIRTMASYAEDRPA
jgi:hypothetical protein